MLNHRVSIIVLAYSLVTACLALLSGRMMGEFGTTSMLVGLIGGACCALSAILGFLGRPSRGWAIATLAAVSFVLLAQTIMTWMNLDRIAVQGVWGGITITVMFVLSVALVTFLAHAGEGDVPVKFEKGGAPKRRSA